MYEASPDQLRPIDQVGSTSTDCATTTHSAKRCLTRYGTNNRGRRAVEMLEFALLMPIFLFLVLFSIDMGVVVMQDGIIHDAAFVGARADAQVGGGQYGYQSAYSAVQDQLKWVPALGSGASNAEICIPGVPGCSPGATQYVPPTVGYSYCSSAPGPNGEGTYIEVQLTVPVRLLTPGLNGLLLLIDPGANGPGNVWSLSATGVARCEIVTN